MGMRAVALMLRGERSRLRHHAAWSLTPISEARRTGGIVRATMVAGRFSSLDFDYLEPAVARLKAAGVTWAAVSP